MKTGNIITPAPSTGVLKINPNEAHQLTQENRQAQKKRRAVFNRTNDNIEWAKWTWNPVTGCSHISAGCAHCYAERFALRLQAAGLPKLACEAASRAAPSQGATTGAFQPFAAWS